MRSVSSPNAIKQIQIEDENEFLELRSLKKYLKKPKMADKKIIQKFLQSLLSSGLVFKERELVDMGTLFENYIEFLDGKIYYDGMKDVREKIITKCIFFPTISEILSFQADFKKEVSYMIICINNSLDDFWYNCPIETFEKLRAITDAEKEAA